MIGRFIGLILGISLLGSSQEKLTEEDKETLLSKVEALEESVIEGNEDSQVNAIRVFDDALKSESETYKLFEKCRKKVYFQDEKRDDQDARKSERMVEDVISDEFKRALLHQLYFLRHSLEAKHHPERRMIVAKRLVDGLGQIVQDEDELNYEMVFNREVPGYAEDSDKVQARLHKSRFQKGVLGGKVYSPLYQDPFQSVFAQAYKVDHLRPDDWMNHPMDFNGLYRNVILRHLVEEEKFAEARDQWATRIKGESALHMYHGLRASDKGDTPASYDKFRELTIPSLRWEAEQFFYSEGDEKASATNLYSILVDHQEHPKYLEWVKWFKEELE